MTAPKGNQYWKLRTKHGRDKLFATPDQLWEAACEYFEWADDNPYVTVKETTRTVPVRRMKQKGKKTIEETVYEEQVQREETPTARPYSLTGLCIYLGVYSRYWHNLKASMKGKDSPEDEEYQDVMTRIEETIETQQFEGAVVGAFNANIISRRLGLVDKQEIDHTTGGQKFPGFSFLPYTEAADEVE